MTSSPKAGRKSWVGLPLASTPSRGVHDIRNGMPANGSATKRRPESVLVRMLVLLAFALPGHAAEPAFFQARVAPILDRHCTGCHGETKQKAKLRLDTYELLMQGSDAGPVLEPGNAKASEMVRRINLPDDDDEVMPSEGKSRLSPDEVKIIELWVAGGASDTTEFGEFPGVPVPPRPKPPKIPLAPDWRPRAAEIAALQAALGVKLVPRSQVPTDGLVVRTATAPARCDDAALARLAPLADLIVEAELGRTKITDAGLASLSGCANLRILDLTRTAVTSRGMAALMALPKLETLNLTDTAVAAEGAARLKALPALQRIWLFGTPAMPEDPQ